MTATMPTTNLLAAIAANEEKVAPDLPRLTTAGVFVHYQRLGKALEQAVDAYKRLPDMVPKTSDEVLLEIAKQCDAASKLAMRLLEANK